MNRLRDMPISRKVALVVLLSCWVALLIACGLMTAYQAYRYQINVGNQIVVLADMFARNNVDALYFADPKAATENLAVLETDPHVSDAAIYGADGKLFARFVNTNSVDTLPKIAPALGKAMDAGGLSIARPILREQKRIGTILLRNNLQGLYERLRAFLVVTVVVLLVSSGLALALVVPMQRTISRPILLLTEAVRGMGAGKNFAARVPAEGRDEAGQLAAAFNDLMAHIQQRDTALLSANESLSASQSQLRTILENLTEGLVVSTLGGGMLHFNRAALTLHGHATVEESQKSLADLAGAYELRGMDGRLWSVEEWPLSRILRGETVRNLEVRFRYLPHGVPRIFNYGGTLVRDDAGKPLMGIVMMSDITERKLAEQKVGEQLARVALLNQITRAIGERLDLQSIFQVVCGTVEDQLPVDFCCICLHAQDTNSLTVATVGPRSEPLAATMKLARREEVPIGQNGLSRCVSGVLVYEPDVSASAHPFPQRLAAAGLRAFVAAPLWVESRTFGVLIAARRAADSFSSGECEFLRQLGEQVALAAHQAQLHNALQQAYDDLRQTQQAVMQQERLRALGQMASGIAHDINNAISPVALYTESLLENEPNLSERARSYLGTIQHSIEDVAQTVARMREFYRQRETQLVLLPVQLNPLVQQVVELSRVRWSDIPQQRGVDIDLKTELADDLPSIAGVESEIREALLNLVFNAVDAMPDGGKITVRTKHLAPVPGAKEGRVDSISIEVSDTGMGMSEDTRRRCLEPFFTTKGERGTGLGLAMVYGIAQRHGADIEIDSEVGRGTTFRMIFPVSSLAPVSTTAGPAALPRTRMRILIIDDDPLLIKSLRDTLEMDGHAVVTASGGQAGIDAFHAARARNESFAVVITDLGMPYVDGRKVAAAIKTASPGTPVLMLTGWGQRLVAEGDIPPHVDRVLNKPPKLRELREALAACQPANQG